MLQHIPASTNSPIQHRFTGETSWIPKDIGVIHSSAYECWQGQNLSTGLMIGGAKQCRHSTEPDCSVLSYTLKLSIMKCAVLLLGAWLWTKKENIHFSTVSSSPLRNQLLLVLGDSVGGASWTSLTPEIYFTSLCELGSPSGSDIFSPCRHGSRNRAHFHPSSPACPKRGVSQRKVVAGVATARLPEQPGVMSGAHPA